MTFPRSLAHAEVYLHLPVVANSVHAGLFHCSAERRDLQRGSQHLGQPKQAPALIQNKFALVVAVAAALFQYATHCPEAFPRAAFRTAGAMQI